MPSDHVLLLATVKIALSSVKRPPTQGKLALDRIKDPKIKTEISSEVNTRIQKITPNIGEDLTQSWTKITEIMMNTMQT